MAGLNEGDVMEGIFSIGIADMFAYGTANKTRINSIRAQIDTKMFQTGTYDYVVYDKNQQLKGFPADHVTIRLKMRLKHGSTQWAYGDDWAIDYNNIGDIGNIDSKINQIVGIINGPNYVNMIQTAKNNWLKNNTSDKVVVDIIADGIAGEQSGGNVKGDIMVNIQMNDDQILSEEMIFSLKSCSNTVAGAPEVDPVTVSFSTKFEVVPVPFSVTTLSPSEFKM